MDTSSNSEVIVVRLGSYSVNIGFPSQRVPITYPNVIGIRTTHHPDMILGEEPKIPEPIDKNKTNDLSILSSVSSIYKLPPQDPFQTHVQENVSLSQPPRDRRRKKDPVDEKNKFVIRYTPLTTPLPPFIFGEDALKLHSQLIFQQSQSSISEKSRKRPREENSTGYSLFWPIRKGRFNYEFCPHSVEFITDSLIRIILYGLNKLNISPKQHSDYSVILVIQESYSKREIKELLNIFCRKLSFKGILLQQDTICSVYGSGLSSGCVLDIGHTQTTIVCVEEGIPIPQTKTYLNYSSSTIESLLFSLFQTSTYSSIFPIFSPPDPSFSLPYMEFIIRSLKEKLVNLNHEQASNRKKRSDRIDMYIQQASLNPFPNPKEQTRLNNLKKNYQKENQELFIHLSIPVYSTPFFIASIGLFYPKIFQELSYQPFRIKESNESESINENKNEKKNEDVKYMDLGKLEDTEDVYDEQFLAEIALSTPAPKNASIPDPQNKSEEESGSMNLKSQSECSLPLHEALICSIEKSGKIELMKKFISSIILVGGGSMIHGLKEFLERQLLEQLYSLHNQQSQNRFKSPPSTPSPSHFPFPFPSPSPSPVSELESNKGQIYSILAERLEVLNPLREELSSNILSWRGASVVANLESSKEFWVNSQDFCNYGIKAAREKCSFLI